MNLETTRLRGRPNNRWQDGVREDGRLVGGKGWKERVYNREEWKKLQRTARNRRILHMPMERMNEKALLTYHILMYAFALTLYIVSCIFWVPFEIVGQFGTERYRCLWNKELIAKKTTCNQQQTILPIYDNILNTVHVNYE
jgi:hypothetical protein